MGEVSQKLDKLNRQDNVAATTDIRNQGVKFLTPSDNAIAELESLIGPANQRLMETGKLTPQMVETLERLLAEYRQTHAAEAH